MIYEIPSEYLALISLIKDTHDKESLENNVALLNLDFDKSHIFIAKEIKNLQAEYEGVYAAKKLLETRLSRLNNIIDTLQSYVVENIEKSGLCEPIKCDDMILKLQRKPPSVVIFEPDLIPDMYKVVKETISFDKIKLKTDIQEGFLVEGARIEQNNKLVIK